MITRVLFTTRGHRWIIFTRVTGPIPVTALVFPMPIRLELVIHHGITPMVITDFIHPATTHITTTRIGGPIGDIARPTGLVTDLKMVVDMIAMPAKVANGVDVRVMVKRIFQARITMLLMILTHRFPVMFPRHRRGTRVTRVW